MLTFKNQTYHLNKQNNFFHGELVPNCLMSLYPIYLIDGPRSLFDSSAPWGVLPSYLAEHGYEVTHLRGAWNEPAHLIQNLKNILIHNRQAGHYWLHPNWCKEEEVKTLFFKTHPHSTLTNLSFQNSTFYSSQNNVYSLGLLDFNSTERSRSKSSMITQALHKMLIKNHQAIHGESVFSSEQLQKHGQVILNHIKYLAELDYSRT